MNGRKRNRKLNFDYSQDGIYFITINTKNMVKYFGFVEDGEMGLSALGKIAHERILWLEKQYAYVELHNFVVMPNHLHLLFGINSSKVQGEDVKIKSVSSLISAYKMQVSKEINLMAENNFKWHRSFHDHIVRNEQSFERIFNYITNNPKNWKDDKFFL